MSSPDLDLLDGPPVPVRRPVGRPPRGSTSQARKKHITVLWDLTVRGMTQKQTARKHGISVSTVKRYRDAALTYADPRVDAIRHGLGLVNPDE